VVATALSSRRDSLDEDSSFARPDLEVEVAQEVHAENAVDVVAEVSNVYVHVGHGDAECRELHETNDVAMFLRDRGMDDTPDEETAVCARRYESR
jgi:hypothetical protein